ncbi:type 2 isopentenyl-diphosphate Delta-isomerase [Thermofilum pendens]|uniref:Isopentenyl-diphosphate delta-isomerase n=1 Tax=Thermofilum pendens (strain DSM 2475 / Hrk 5) TaxID=368408 RepID=A1RWV2_THEPD|nr:type 2 isopentenyl-diphosphate Delta-isomerase [Thermofilum pendens]ABL77682.1 isopentenyl-diphosphate delta-isomerase, type 2 [Thermofilum pendens Hrk 5]
MSSDIIFTRKDQHLVYSLKENVQARGVTTLLECVRFVHQTVLEANFSDVDVSTKFLGYEVAAPIVISGMTGGTPMGGKVNAMLAEVAQRLKVPIGVGSQRAALKDRAAVETFRVVREKAPDVPVIANIGASQVSMGLSAGEVQELLDMVGADALAVHLNPLQEVLQPEGEPSFKNFLGNLREIVKSVKVPVILKQTGEGFSRESALKIADTGVKGVDVGGAGGTSFAVIEGLRARYAGLDLHEEIAFEFAGWGIPTAASVLEVRSALPDILLIATGGIRSGLDAAKVIRLGADFAGLALPVLKEVYYRGVEGGYRFLEKVIRELKIAVFLTGGRTLADLKNAPIVITGELKDWVVQRGLRV